MELEKYQKMLLALMQQLTGAVETCRAAVEAMPSSRTNSDVQILLDKYKVLLIKLPASILPSENEIPDFLKRIVLNAWLKKVSDESDSSCINLLGYEACIRHLSDYSPEYTLTLCTKLTDLLPENPQVIYEQTGNAHSRTAELAGVLSTLKITLAVAKEKNSTIEADLGLRMQPLVNRCVMQYGTSSLILSRLSLLLLYCPAFVPPRSLDGTQLDLDLLLIDAVANLRRIQVKTIDHMTNVSHLIYCIWNCSSVEQILHSLKAIYAIIANRDPSAHLSPALAHLLTLVPPVIVRQLAPHILQMPSCNSSENFKVALSVTENTLSRLYIWLSGWPPASDTLLLWQQTLVCIMVRNGMMRIVEEVACEVVPKLMNIMKLPAIRDRLLDALALLLVSCQSSPLAYRKCFECLVLWGKMLKSEDLSNPKPIHLKFSKMCQALAHLFPACHDVNAQLSALLIDFPHHDLAAVVHYVEEHDWAGQPAHAGHGAAAEGAEGRVTGLADAAIGEGIGTVPYLPSQTELPDSSIMPRINRLPAGIDNIGSTCYYNAIIQALFATDTFRHAVVSCQHSSCEPLSVLQELFSLLLFTEQDSIEPTKDMVRTAAPDYFEPGQQHDASEFLGHLLDTLKESERNIIEEAAGQRHEAQLQQQSNGPVGQDSKGTEKRGLEPGTSELLVDMKSQKTSPKDTTDDTNSTENLEAEPKSTVGSVTEFSCDYKGRRDSAIDNMTDDAMDSTPVDCSRSQILLESYKTDSYAYSSFYSVANPESSRSEITVENNQSESTMLSSQRDELTSSQTDSRVLSGHIDSTIDNSQTDGYMESSPIENRMVCGKFSVQTDSGQSIHDQLDSDVDLENNFKDGFDIGKTSVVDSQESVVLVGSNPNVRVGSRKDEQQLFRRHSSPKAGVREGLASDYLKASDDSHGKYEIRASKKVKANVNSSVEFTRRMNDSSIISVSISRNDGRSSDDTAVWRTSCESNVQDSSCNIKDGSSCRINGQISLPDSETPKNGDRDCNSSSKEVLKQVFLYSNTSEHCLDGRPLKRKGSSFSGTTEDDPQKSPRDDVECEFSPSGIICSDKNTSSSEASSINYVLHFTTEKSSSSSSGWSASSSVNDMEDLCKRDVSTTVMGETSTTVTGDGTASDDNSDSGISIQDDLANSVMDTASTVGGVTEEEEVEGDEELTEISQVAVDEGVVNRDENSPCAPHEDPISSHQKEERETFVEKTFGGRSVRLTHCLNCNCVSENYDDSLDLKVSFEDCAGKSDDLVSLDKLIRHSLKKQELVGSEQYFCGACDSKQDAEIHTAIVKAPEFLILAQNRFIYNSSTNEENKILTQVDFEDHLELPVWDISRLKDHIRAVSENSVRNSSYSCTSSAGPASSYSFNSKNSLVSWDTDADRTASSLPNRTEKLSLNLSEPSIDAKSSTLAGENNDIGEECMNKVSCDKSTSAKSPDSNKAKTIEPNTAAVVIASVPLKNSDVCGKQRASSDGRLNVQMSDATDQLLDSAITSSEVMSPMGVKDSVKSNGMAELFSSGKSQENNAPCGLASENNTSLETVAGSDCSYVAEIRSINSHNPRDDMSERSALNCTRSNMDSCKSEGRSAGLLTERHKETRTSESLGCQVPDHSMAAGKSGVCASSVCNGQNSSVLLQDAVGKERYVLYAIVVHSGRISRAGHYFCYVRSSSAAVASSLTSAATSSSLARGCGWVELNDNKAYATNFKDLKSSLTGCSRDCAPYLMFYQKVSGDAVIAPTRVEEELHSLPPHLQETVRRHVHYHRVRGGRSKHADSRGPADGGGAGGSGGTRGTAGPQTTGCGGGSALDVVRFIY
ncbi:Peptidase C19 ubiquitin carboxyl-terminal hydrolase [Trinorchestia longiramus]|nr:Peptidase C19 ubiquitin carboxyl-terminal hydrolase [Trinorchestia longiramus]